MPPASSVFTGEALAILEALSFIESHRLNNSVIFSDSKSCLQSILNNPFKTKFKFPFILKIRHLLLRCLAQNIRVEMAWIPAHSGIIGNEKVDFFAKKATTSGGLSQYKVYSHDLISLAKTRMMRDWSEFWSHSSATKGKFYASVQGSILVKPWFFKYRKASKWVISTVCRIRLSHSCTPVFLHKIRVKDSSLCECGLEGGTLEHIFFNCPKLQFSLYDVLPLDIPRPTNLRSLLSLVHSQFIDILCTYINQNNIRL